MPRLYVVVLSSCLALYVPVAERSPGDESEAERNSEEWSIEYILVRGDKFDLAAGEHTDSRWGPTLHSGGARSRHSHAVRELTAQTLSLTSNKHAKQQTRRTSKARPAYRDARSTRNSGTYAGTRKVRDCRLGPRELLARQRDAPVPAAPTDDQPTTRATRYGEGRASPRSFLTHHVANISTAPIQAADAQSILNAASARMLRAS
jgi:hypothetical protein